MSRAANNFKELCEEAHWTIVIACFIAGFGIAGMVGIFYLWPFVSSNIVFVKGLVLFTLGIVMMFIARTACKYDGRITVGITRNINKLVKICKIIYYD